MHLPRLISLSVRRPPRSVPHLLPYSGAPLNPMVGALSVPVVDGQAILLVIALRGSETLLGEVSPPIGVLTHLALVEIFINHM